jgi:CrcB protein
VGVTRPHHTDPALVASVAAGGALGSLARYGVALALPARAGWPLGTLTVNLAGSFLLGLLLEALSLAGDETPRRRWLRLTLGTGLLGGFTTYSAFALELRGLLAGGQAGVALGYGVGSVVGGLAACLAGVALAGALRRRPAPAAVAGERAVADEPAVAGDEEAPS